MWTQRKIWIPGLNNSKKKDTQTFSQVHGVLVAACGIKFLDQRLNLGPPALEAQNLSYCTIREVPQLFLLGKGQGFSYTRSVSRDFHKHPGQLKPHWAQALSSAWLFNSQVQPKVHGFPCPRWAALCIHTTGLSIPLPAPTRDKDGSSGPLPPAHDQLLRQGERAPKETAGPPVVWPLLALGPHLPLTALVPASRSLHLPFPVPVSFFPSPLLASISLSFQAST